MTKVLTSFLLWTFVFASSYILLSMTGLIPLELVEVNSRIEGFFSKRADATDTNPKVSLGEKVDVAPAPAEFNETELPDRIIIEKIGVNTPVINPETRDIAVLDQALLKGVVRFPGSGGLDDESNMFLFGHSTSFQNVRNTAFQALNRLGELQIGDTIRVTSGDTEYLYKVIAVSQVNKDEALVEFSSGEKLLTLSTCDTFGARSDRFVATARFVQAKPVSGSL